MIFDILHYQIVQYLDDQTLNMFQDASLITGVKKCDMNLEEYCCSDKLLAYLIEKNYFFFESTIKTVYVGTYMNNVYRLRDIV